MTTSDITPRWKRYLSPRFIIGKVREKGVVWCTYTIWRKVWSSLDFRTRSIRAKIWSVPDNMRYRGKKQPDVLYAFYDLAVSPATFDIVKFLLFAELDREEFGCTSLHVVIVPGRAEGFRVGDLKAYQRTGGGNYDIDYMRWRLRNVLAPCCWLIPSCRQVTVCTSREEVQVFQASLVKHIFPKGYTARFPIENYGLQRIIAATSQRTVLPSIQATPQALRFVNNWIQAKAGRRKVITITLRECSYEQDRNSNIKEWSAFARSLDSAVYCPVVIRDTEAAFKHLPPELEGLTVFSEISWNIELRAALYELSYMNLFVNSGPPAICSFNRRACSIRFKMITPSCGATTAHFFHSAGLLPGSQMSCLTPFHRLVWEDDKLEVIQREFEEMCDRIERYRTEPGKLDT